MRYSKGWLVVLLLVATAIAMSFIVAAASERAVAGNTFLLGILTCCLALPLSILAARICLLSGSIPRLLWLSVVCLAFTPVFMHVSAWDSAFGKLGWIANLGGSRQDVLRWVSAVWIHTSAAFPQTTLVIWFALFRTGESLEEQALLDASAGTVFWQITIPRMWPILVFCGLWIFVGCSREIAVTDIYRIGTFAEQIYLGYALGDFAGGSNATVLLPIDEFSLPVVLFIFGSATALSWTLFGYLTRIRTRNDDGPRYLKSCQPKDSMVGALLMMILVGMPLLNLIMRGCKTTEMVNDVPVTRYSIHHLLSILAEVPGEFSQEMNWSAVIAGTSAILSFLLAILIVWRARESAVFRWMLAVLFSICMTLPGPLIGSIVLNARDWLDATWYMRIFDRTIAAPLVANLIFCWPFATIMAWIIVDRVSSDALDGAKLDGTGSLGRLTRIVLAGNLHTLVGFGMLLFAMCFGELSASQLAVPPGIDTIPRRMLGLLHSGVNDVTAGLTLFLSGLIILICTIGFTLVRWKHRI